MAVYLDTAGFTDPFIKIFITNDANLVMFCFLLLIRPGQLTLFLSSSLIQPLLPYILFLYVLGQLPKFNYDASAGVFLSKNSGDALDGTPFAVGMLTLVRDYSIVLILLIPLLC